MLISKDKYNKLVFDNKNLTEEVNELKGQLKYLTVTNDEYYKGAVKWRSMYIKMKEVFDNGGTKSSIIEQRDAEIEALKHMIERLETEKEKITKEHIAMKEAVDKAHGESGMIDAYTKLVLQREDYKALIHNLQKDNDKLVEDLNECHQKLNYYATCLK